MDYTDPESGRSESARTWWRPDIRNLGELSWEHLADEAAARLLVESCDCTEDEISLLIQRVLRKFGSE
jgi:hypothetical protein